MIGYCVDLKLLPHDAIVRQRGVTFIPVVGWGISIGIGAADLIGAISFIIG
jgi:hypothetical protein